MCSSGFHNRPARSYGRRTRCSGCTEPGNDFYGMCLCLFDYYLPNTLGGVVVKRSANGRDRVAGVLNYSTKFPSDRLRAALSHVGSPIAKYPVAQIVSCRYSCPG